MTLETSDACPLCDIMLAVPAAIACADTGDLVAAQASPRRRGDLGDAVGRKRLGGRCPGGAGPPRPGRGRPPRASTACSTRPAGCSPGRGSRWTLRAANSPLPRPNRRSPVSCHPPVAWPAARCATDGGTSPAPRERWLRRATARRRQHAVGGEPAEQDDAEGPPRAARPARRQPPRRRSAGTRHTGSRCSRTPRTTIAVIAATPAPRATRAARSGTATRPSSGTRRNARLPAATPAPPGGCSSWAPVRQGCHDRPDGGGRAGRRTRSTRARHRGGGRCGHRARRPAVPAGAVRRGRRTGAVPPAPVDGLVRSTLPPSIPAVTRTGHATHRVSAAPR